MPVKTIYKQVDIRNHLLGLLSFDDDWSGGEWSHQESVKELVNMVTLAGFPRKWVKEEIVSWLTDYRTLVAGSPIPDPMLCSNGGRRSDYVKSGPHWVSHIWVHRSFMELLHYPLNARHASGWRRPNQRFHLHHIVVQNSGTGDLCCVEETNPEETNPEETQSKLAEITHERNQLVQKNQRHTKTIGNLVKKQRRLRQEIAGLKNEREDLWRERDANRILIQDLQEDAGAL